MKIITVGGATQDVFLQYEAPNSHCSLSALLETFQPGKKIEVADIVYITGGGATNTAVALSLLGFNVSTLCSLGNDAASSAILHELKLHAIDTSLTSHTSLYETGKSFIIKTIGKDRTIFTYRGSNNTLSLDKLSDTELKNTNALYISSLSKQAAESLPQMLSRARQYNVQVTLNPGSSQLANNPTILKEALKSTSTFIVNACEAVLFMETLTGDILRKQKPEDLIDCLTPYLLTEEKPGNFNLGAFFKKILSLGPTTVIVTNGVNGVYAATSEEILFMPSLKTEIVDTVGAGDAFGSCFTASMLQNYSLESSLKRGIINSSSVLQYTGAKKGLLTLNQINTQEKEIILPLTVFPPER